MTQNTTLEKQKGTVEKSVASAAHEKNKRHEHEKPTKPKNQSNLNKNIHATDASASQKKSTSDKTLTLARKKSVKKPTRPGHLLGRVPLDIHTSDAHWLFSGTAIKKAVGLLQFSSQMNRIWDAAKQDDPYADWYLLKVYDGIVTLRKQLAEYQQKQHEKICEQYDGHALQAMPFASEKPIVKSLWFRTQYGYLGARVIADFDRLMRTALTARRLGVLLDQSYEVMREIWSSKIIVLLKLPFKWQSLQMTRSHYNNQDARVARAKQLMGVLPHEVLDKTLRAPFAPMITHTIPIKKEADNIQKKIKMKP